MRTRPQTRAERHGCATHATAADDTHRTERHARLHTAPPGSVTPMDHGAPGSYLTLTPGTDVVSSDGETVGKVEHVLADEGTEIFDGIVIDIRLGPRRACASSTRRRSASIFERAVVLSVAAAEVDQLPEPTASPGVIENHGVEDSESPLQGKLRRAWDRISGRY